MAIGGARRRCAEIGFTIGGARDAGRRMLHPLRRKRCREGSQHDAGQEDFTGSNTSWQPLYT